MTPGAIPGVVPPTYQLVVRCDHTHARELQRQQQHGAEIPRTNI